MKRSHVELLGHWLQKIYLVSRNGARVSSLSSSSRPYNVMSYGVTFSTPMAPLLASENE